MKMLDSHENACALIFTKMLAYNSRLGSKLSKALSASALRVSNKHVLPNVSSLIFTFVKSAVCVTFICSPLLTSAESSLRAYKHTSKPTREDGHKQIPKLRRLRVLLKLVKR